MAQRRKTVPIVGGLDLVSNIYEIEPSSFSGVVNYEMVARGCRRIDGWEAYDGNPKPSDCTPQSLGFDAGTTAFVDGEKITGGTSGAYGWLIEVGTVTAGSWVGNDAEGTFLIRNITGVFVNDETLTGDVAGAATSDGTLDPSYYATQAEFDADFVTAHAAAVADISVITGSGGIRGVFTLKDETYAVRDNAGATAAVMFKATSTGWVSQSLGHTLDFTTGDVAEPAEGEVITGGTSGATATVERIVLQSGAWGGTAAGYFVLSGISGTFQSEALSFDVSSTTANIAGDADATTLPAGGEYHTIERNFYATETLMRLYGANGVGYAFEWDGTVFCPIRTGTTTALDKPQRVAEHAEHLFLSFDGGSLQFSSIGVPVEFITTTGAGEIGFGQNITGLIDDASGALVIGGRNSMGYLTGTSSSDFVLKKLSKSSGALANSMQLVDQPIYVDDAGFRKMDTTQAFGDWKIGTISAKIDPLWQAINLSSTISVIGSMTVKRKDQYRIFFSNGTGITIYFGRNRDIPEFTIFDLSINPEAVHSGEVSGDEVLYMGSDDGWVYQLDSGASANGALVEAYIRMAWATQGDANVYKRYHRSFVEIDGDAVDMTFGVIAQFDFGSDDQPSKNETDYSVPGSGGLWNIMIWDDFIWSAALGGEDQVTVDLDGYGRSLSLIFVSDTIFEDPHVIKSFTTNYTVRRTKR